MPLTGASSFFTSALEADPEVSSFFTGDAETPAGAELFAAAAAAAAASILLTCVPALAWISFRVEKNLEVSFCERLRSSSVDRRRFFRSRTSDWRWKQFMD